MEEDLKYRPEWTSDTPAYRSNDLEEAMELDSDCPFAEIFNYLQ